MRNQTNDLASMGSKMVSQWREMKWRETEKKKKIIQINIYENYIILEYFF